MVKAIHNNVVLEKKDTKQVNGIYIPNAKSDCFVVLNVGSQVTTVNCGDTVILKDKPLEYTEGSVKYYITNIENIIAVVED